MVSGLHLNVVAESSQVRLLDVIVTVNDKQATLEEFETVMKSKSSVPPRYPVSMPACVDLGEIIVRYACTFDLKPSSH